MGHKGQIGEEARIIEIQDETTSGTIPRKGIQTSTNQKVSRTAQTILIHPNKQNQINGLVNEIQQFC